MAQTSWPLFVTDVQTPAQRRPGLPVKPLDIFGIIDYPMELLLLKEDGHTSLGLNVDSQGAGLLRHNRLMSSGSARLDLRANPIARTWLF